MLLKSKQFPLILFAVLLVSTASIASAAEDHESPEERLQVCLKYCDERYAHPVKLAGCESQCQKKYAEEREGSQGGEERDILVSSTTEDPESVEKHLSACIQQCDRQGRPSQAEKEYCVRQCQEKYSGERESEQEEGTQQENNPYVFEDQHFSTPFESQQGRLRTLQRFTERSELLRGLENYRISILEAEPQTFIVPNHWDAEVTLFVAKGRGSVSMIRADKRESFNFRRGDIVRIPPGTTTYLINRDDNEKLILAKLIQPVSIPDRFQAFFGSGSENPESYYKVFRNEILEAAYNVRGERFQKLLGQQKQGVFIKASKEQIRALSENEESETSFNIFQEQPLHQNQYGRIHVVRPEDHQQLQHLDVGVSYINMTQGAMLGPIYNSRATKIGIVLQGEGKFEMACPHLSSQSGEQSKGGVKYQKASARLRRGTVVVIPTGHPFVAVSSNNQNLEVVCFDLNARHNQKIPLAGRKNVVNYYHTEAKELAFGVSSREVDQVFGSQEGEYFFKGPREQHQGRADE